VKIRKKSELSWRQTKRFKLYGRGYLQVKVINMAARINKTVNWFTCAAVAAIAAMKAFRIQVIQP